MSAICRITSMIALTAFACTAFAQEAVGELLDVGATKATKQGLVDAMAGSKITGVTSSGRADMNIDLKADGTLSGYLVARQNNATSGTIGKWWVEDDGKLC